MALDVSPRVEPEEMSETSTPRSCPPSLEQVVTLRAGRFLLRPLRVGDSLAYADFIARMHESDLRHRFVGHGHETLDSAFAHHSQIYPNRDVSFIAVRQCGRSREEIVGEVCTYRYPGVSTAEVGIIVRSDMKRQGVGGALMGKMIEYARASWLELIARIRPENTAMVRLAERSGMEVEHRPGSEFAIAHIRLSDAPQRQLQTNPALAQHASTEPCRDS